MSIRNNKSILSIGKLLFLFFVGCILTETYMSYTPPYQTAGNTVKNNPSVSLSYNDTQKGTALFIAVSLNITTQTINTPVGWKLEGQLANGTTEQITLFSYINNPGNLTTTTITITGGAGTYLLAAVFIESRMIGPAQRDPNSVGTATGSITTLSTASLTTKQSPDLVIAAYGQFSNKGALTYPVFSSPTNGFAIPVLFGEFNGVVPPNGQGMSIAIANLTDNSIGNINTSATSSLAGVWCSLILSYNLVSQIQIPSSPIIRDISTMLRRGVRELSPIHIQDYPLYLNSPIFPFAWQVDYAFEADWITISCGIFNWTISGTQTQANIYTGLRIFHGRFWKPNSLWYPGYPANGLGIAAVHAQLCASEYLIPWGRNLTFVVEINSSVVGSTITNGGFDIVITPFNNLALG